MEDLICYEGHDSAEPETEVSASLPSSLKPWEIIEEILDDQVVSTRCGGYQKCWIAVG